eukprot:GDKI01047256.1.p1 GENE.GDKI01047256.1~~GDKI01047256.1.p1  ORF type:complete len:286 (-),score=133.84 GDKI01047256.1:221-1078(-)
MSKKFYDRLLKSDGTSAKAFTSSFGAKMLKKFGWEEGKGLGKDLEGEVKPVQVKRRDENIGLGHESKKAEDQWKNWWSDAFNSVASKIQVVGGGPQGKAPTASTHSSDDSSDDSDEETPKTKHVAGVSDRFDSDGLLAACGGRTGRRADRQQGKLKRVLMQDGRLPADSARSESPSEVSSKKEKKRKAETQEAQEEDETETRERKREKKEKKAKKQQEEDVCVEEEEGEEERRKREKKEKKREKKQREAEAAAEAEQAAEEEEEVVSKKDKKKKKKARREEDDEE